MNIEKQASLEALSQNREDLQTQIARIKQALENVCDKNTSSPERIRTWICEQIVLIISTLTAFVTGTATIVLSLIRLIFFFQSYCTANFLNKEIIIIIMSQVTLEEEEEEEEG